MSTIINIQQKQSEMEEQFLQCLRDRDIPSRFSYWGKKESTGWLNVCSSNDYSVYCKGEKMIKQYAESIVKSVMKVGIDYNFISLGIGNGVKDSYIIDSFLKELKKIKYFPIDISWDMVNEGVKNLRQKNLDIVAYVADFEDFHDISTRIRSSYASSHFISILGNTLGNFGQVEVLNNIRNGMVQNDYLLLEITMREQVGSKTKGENLTDIVGSYNNDDYKNFVFSPLEKVGFVKSDGVIEVEYGPNQFYPKLYSIELWFRLKKDKLVHYHGQEIVFKKDERIRLYVSHKYTYENIRELLDGNGFQMCDFKVVEDNYGLILCKPKS